MKIYSSRRDDLIAERDAYDAETQKYEDIASEGDRRRREAEEAEADAIENEIRALIGDTFLQLRFSIRPSWNFSGHDRGYEVNITSDDWNKSDDNVALSWHWDVKVDDEGNVIKETGSWSGLKAATPDQLDSLQESVRVLRILNSINWLNLLDRAIPKLDDEARQAARTASERRFARKDFNALIADAEFEEAVESGDWIKLNGRPETSYYRGAKGGNWWAKILKVSDSFVTCLIVNDFPDSERVQDSLKWKSEERIKKSNFARHVAHPIETYKA